MTEQLWRVAWGQFCCGVIVREGVVTEAAPKLRWSVGQPLIKLVEWVADYRQLGSIRKIAELDVRED